MKTIYLLATAASFLAASAASAAPVLYTGDAGRTNFATATAAGVLLSDGFEGITTPTSNGIGSVPEGTSFARTGYTVSTGGIAGATLTVLDNTYVNGGNQIRNRFGSGAGSVVDDAYGDLTFSFAAPVNAFGLDIATIARGFSGASTGTFTLTVNGTPFAYSYSGSSGFGFLGITTDTAFTSLTIATSKSNDSLFDNVRFGSTLAATPAVPEPATWGMMILGFGVVGAAMRRRVRASEVRFNAEIKSISQGEAA